ncbi:translocation protein [Rhodofomes roseus]|uniref:Translocation protein SEC62 n=1 Tax=Rhodofomes roseus TaxID=34475 RepID=A0ABQ8K7X0_9APHY|nr:translocation protein [Rhodofomes roseus]KAH9833253.1 translocation protein [Rhodofomes roseus]
MNEQQAKAPQDLRNVVNYLRSSKAGMKIRVGILNGKRIDYFKGRSAIKALLAPTYTKLKNVPPVTNEAEASTVLTSVIPFAFYLHVDRGQPSGSSNSPKLLTLEQMQTAFDASHYYAWFYEGSQWTTYAGGLAMVAIMLAGVMFPLWPPVMRLYVWYLSIGVLGLVGLFFAIAIVRLIFYIITVIVASPGIWIFPKLFADVGFVESFIPLWEWDFPKKKGKKRRVEREKGKGRAAPTEEGSALIEEVGDSGSSRPASRTARVEDVPEDD